MILAKDAINKGIKSQPNIEWFITRSRYLGE
jgi:hypothetical protein